MLSNCGAEVSGESLGIARERSVFIPIPKKGNAKECSNCLTSALISHTSKVMLKILQAKLQQYVNQELPDIKTWFRKGRGMNCQHLLDHRKMQENSRKTSTSASLTTLKPLTVWITTNWKFLQRWEYQTTLPASWETCMQAKKQQSEPDLEQQTASKLRKKNVKAVYCHPAYSTYMQSTSCDMAGWINLKLESRLPGEISTTSDMQMISS